MNRKQIAIAIGILIIAGILVYAGRNNLQTEKAATPPPAATGTQAHQDGAPAGKTGGETRGGVEHKPGEPAKAAEEPPSVEISLEKQQMIGVKIAVVSTHPLEQTIRTVGRVEYDERKFATINTKYEGWIEKLYVDYTGKYVKKGERVAEIYSPELYATQQEYLNLSRWTKEGREGGLGDMLRKDASTVLEAARQRLRLWDITETQIEEIEKTGKPIRRLAVYSPVSGYITQKTVVEGMKIMAGEKLFDVADLSAVWIVSDIYEYELPSLRSGQKARITLSYFPGKVFTSSIEYIYPALAGETRTAKVRFSLPNPGGQLKPQMFTNVEIRIPLGNRLAVPEDAVIDTGMRQVVYVDKGNGYFEPREIQTGLQAEGFVEVLKGLKTGDRVAKSANFLIDSEARLKGIQPLPTISKGRQTPAPAAPAGGHTH